MTGAKSLPRELLDHILVRTDGVPLFIEELTKTVLESGLLREADGGYELTGPIIGRDTALVDQLRINKSGKRIPEALLRKVSRESRCKAGTTSGEGIIDVRA